MFGGLILSASVLFISYDLNEIQLPVKIQNLNALLFLGIVCTSFAFLVSIWLMNFISPFTIAISYNLEPIYAIILAVLIYPETETMTLKFYLGALIILLAVFFNAFFKMKFSPN